MNKNQIAIGISIVVLIFVVIIFFLSLKHEEANIKLAIEKANYCESDSDCIDAGGKCPFGCYIYVNKNEVEKISQLIKSYESECVYGCVSCPTAICEGKKCKEVCE